MTQEDFIYKLIQEKIKVCIYLPSGVGIRGVIKSQDDFTLIIHLDGIDQLVIKPNVCSILPSRPFKDTNGNQ